MEEDKPTTSQRTEQRGRKRNDALPPSRAREVQRAFRARRAAHLAALEERVKEVETENAELREALHMPPANRPAIRSGPTGRGKVIDTPGASSSTVKMDGDFSGSESGSVDSHGQNTPDAHDGGGNKSRKRHASSNHISRPGSAANDFSPLNSVDSMFNSSRSNGNGGIGGGSNNGSGSRLPYGFNMFPQGAFPAGVGLGQGGGDQRLPFSMNGAGFPSSHLGGGGSPRPEDVLNFQQQLNQHQQNQLNAFSNNNNNGNNNNNNSLPPSNMYPSTLMNLPGSPQNASSPYAAQYQHQLAQQQTYHNLMQQQQQQQPERPLSSNSQHTNNGSGNGDGHPSFPLQNHHRQPSSQHSSPLANGFPSYPQQQQVSTPGGSSSFSNNNNNNAPSRSGTPNFQQQMGRSAAGTPSGRIEIGSAQAYSVMDRLKACCKLDDQAVSSDPGLLAFCNDIVTSLGAQPSDCLLPPSPAPPTPSPTASPASHPSTPNPSSVLSAAHLKSGLYLPIFNVWSVLRQSYPLPFEAAVRDAMEAGSRAAKALLKAAAASSVKVENWKGGKGSYGEKIVCRNSNGVEVERGFLEVYMASLVDGGARKSGLSNGNGVGGGNNVGAGGAVLGSWGGGPGVGTPEMKLESGVGGDGLPGGGGEGL